MEGLSPELTPSESPSTQMVSFPWSEEGLGFEYYVLVGYELRLTAALYKNVNDGS